MLRFFFTILFFLSSFAYLFAQSKIDSLKQVAAIIQNDSLLVSTYLKLYYEYHRIDQKQALDYAVKAEKLSVTANLDLYNARAKYSKALVLRNMRNFEEAGVVLDSALLLFTKLNKTNNIIASKIVQARLAQLQSKLEDALEIYLVTLPLAIETKDKFSECKIYSYLGSLYKIQKQYNKAIDNFQLALSLAKELNLKPAISACLSNLGAMYSLIAEYDKALTYQKLALQLKQESKDKLGASRVLNNIGIIYNNLNQYDVAEQNFNQAALLAKETGNNQMVAYIEYGLTVSAFLKGEFNKCIRRGNRLITQLDALADLDLTTKVYWRMSRAYAKIGEFEKAHAHAVIHYTLADSLYNENMLTITNKMEAQYQNKQKAKEIALLESENNLQEVQIQKRENERNYIIAFAAIVLLLTGLLYNQYRIKKKANAKLKELDQLKSEFFANISHEFRTPLSLIMAPLKEDIEQSKNEKERIKYEMMYRNADRLFNLINQLLDLSKLEGRAIKLEISATEVNHFFKIITASFSSLAEYQKVDFRSEVPEGGTFIELDQDILQKVCYNLLSNAFKFTKPGGEVDFKVSVDKNELRITITDSGKGIPVEDQEKIFDRFFQSSNEQQLGTGIGLALTKQLVQFHQGKIKFESIVDKGSTFTVKIPVKKANPLEKIDTIKGYGMLLQNDVANTKVEKTDDSENKPIILIVEDNPDLRNYLGELLHENYTIRKAQDGVEGIEKAKEIIPDLVISDVTMPGKDGLEVCNELKEATETNHIPVILLTARADQKSKLKGLANGADDYLLKPFDPKELTIRISNLLEQRAKLKEKYTKLLLLEPTEIEISNREEIFLKTVMEVVDKYMNDSAFSVEQFCSELGMSRMQLHRKLTALTGHSATTFVRHQRLVRASQLLASGEPVSQVAYAVGFGSLSYFTRAFKEEFGVVPSEYLPSKV